MIAGKPLIQHVWARCCECPELDDVVVATDDERIAEAVSAFGGRIAMTRDDHPSGTDRIAEVAEQYPEAARVINVQGDEPLIDPTLIAELAVSLRDDTSIGMVTAANVIPPGAPELKDPNVVKVVLNKSQDALYFSRSQIPYPRNETISGLQNFRHKGIYGFQRETLLDFVRWSPTPLEQTEGLEQLRALEHGVKIRVLITDDDSPGVDTPEQAAILNARLEQ